jgi:hypothetical protein
VITNAQGDVQEYKEGLQFTSHGTETFFKIEHETEWQANPADRQLQLASSS